MKNKYTLIFAFVSATFIGCALGPAVPSWIGSYKPITDEGVVIFSTGSEKTSTGVSVGLELNTEQGKKINKYIGVDFSMQKSHFTDHHGNLYSFKLKSGTYFIHAVSANPYFRFINPRIAKITLEPGQKIYLGEFYLAKDGFKLSDKFSRDLSLIKTKDLSLDTASVSRQIPKLITYPEK